MKAVIFDVYHTLLSVEPGPADAADSWVELWRDFFGTAPVIPLTEFNQACLKAVREDHAERKKAGAAWPEVDWRCVVVRAADGLSGLSGDQLDAFLFGHAKLQRTTRAMPGAAAFLSETRQRGIPTGIASNAQGYTLDELTTAGISMDGFADDLCFWSFQHGYSKPDPDIFSWLNRMLAAQGISPAETLMIGDRMDNDMEPAQAAGWQTWHFRGKWPDFVTFGALA